MHLTRTSPPRYVSANAVALFRRASHPAIADVCEILDCGVVTDLTSEQGGRTVLAIGQSAQTSDGVPSFVATPYFASTVDLEAFCAANLEKYRAINIDHDGVPAVWFWQVN